MVPALEDDDYGLGDLPKNFANRQTDTHTDTHTDAIYPFAGPT